MLTGEGVVLRARRRSDVEARYRETAGDHVLHAVTSLGPWRPTTLEAAVAAFDKDVAAGDPDPAATWFAIALREDPALAWVGGAGLWGLQEHERVAHVGITLGAAVRGRGLGTDVLRVLCDYAFRIRDLHRLSLETLASNEPMLRAAAAAGFVVEGRLREAAYLLGERVDEVQLGLLRSEWRPAH